MRKCNKIFVFFVICSLFFIGCKNRLHPDKMIFHYNESAGIATLDPAFAKDQSIIWPCRQIYNGLIELDTALQVKPCIAKSWTISDDGLTYTFTLRNDVLFHTPANRKVVAEDFVYSFSRIIDEKVASPGAWIFSTVRDFAAPDDTTFVIRLNEPFAPFLSELGMVYCSVVPKEVVENYGKEFRSHPCGTGPFHFQYWKEGVKLVLRKNEFYFERDENGRALPYLDAVAITFIVDRQTVFIEFVKGNLDFMNSLDASYKDEILTLGGELKSKYADRIDLTTTPYLNTEYLGFQMEGTQKPLDDIRVRQAINYGFDRRKMMKYLRNNIGYPGVRGFVPMGLPGFSKKEQSGAGYEYNPEKAKKLLADAGYTNGKNMPNVKLSTTSNYLDLCKYIQQQLGLIGINVQVDVNPPAALREQIAQGQVAWFRGSWVADYPDAENYLSLFYSKNRAPAGPNYTRSKNTTFDHLYEQARKETDEERRIALYHQLDKIVMEQAPVIVLYYDQILHFTHKSVHGLQTNAMNNLDLRFVTIDK